MPDLSELFRQLKNRRVIRTAVFYVALVWVALQVGDLLAGAGIVSETVVRGMIFAGVAGFPMVLILSWFYEAPWRERRGLSVAGDVAIILAIVVAVALLAWQQWFRSAERPTVAILRIEPTDTRADTDDLARYLTGRFRMLVATRPEIRVIETGSSLHPALDELPLSARAAAIGADFVLTGTVNQGDGEVRLNIQLFDADGSLQWSERYSDRLLDQAQLQNRVLVDLWPHLPLPADSLAGPRNIVAHCEYPADPEAIRIIAGAGHDGQEEPGSIVPALTGKIATHRDNGLLHLARARAYFRELNQAPAPRRPVLQNLALQDLARAEERCPQLPEIGIMRLLSSLQLESRAAAHGEALSSYPNEARIHLEVAEFHESAGHRETALDHAREAYRLDPLGAESVCLLERLLAGMTGSPGELQALRDRREALPANPGLACR